MKIVNRIYNPTGKHKVYDFVANDRFTWHYDANYNYWPIVPHLWHTMEQFRIQLLNTEDIDEHSMLCKLPYLRRSVLEQGLRFPVFFHHDIITAGIGRILVVHRFAPQLSIAAMIRNSQAPSGIKIDRLNQLVDILIKEKRLESYKTYDLVFLNWLLDVNGDVRSQDVNVDDGKQDSFWFCEDQNNRPEMIKYFLELAKQPISVQEWFDAMCNTQV